jgi:hypothetical protein
LHTPPPSVILLALPLPPQRNPKMKNAVLMLAGVVVAGIVFTLAPLRAQPAAEKPAVQKWDYHHAQHPQNAAPEFSLHKLGDDGWELVAVTEYFSHVNYYFKRPKP